MVFSVVYSNLLEMFWSGYFYCSIVQPWAETFTPNTINRLCYSNCVIIHVIWYSQIYGSGTHFSAWQLWSLCLAVPSCYSHLTAEWVFLIMWKENQQALQLVVQRHQHNTKYITLYISIIVTLVWCYCEMVS